MHDTTAAAEQVRRAAIRAMTPADRLAQALELSEFARRLSLSALRARYPDRGDLELIEICLGTRLIDPEAPRPRR